MTSFRQLIDADYAAIEARTVCWLAGQEDALEEYRQGIDRYTRMAAFIYGIEEMTVNKFPQRFLGKTAILGCGFGMGPPKFRDSCKKMKYVLPLGLEDTAVAAYRRKHPKVKRYWGDVDQCAKRAIIQKGEEIFLRNISFIHKDLEGFPFLLITLPSGRQLAYPRPRVAPSRKFEGSTTIYFYGNIKGTQWGDVDTYGGKLVENVTQAVAADIMANGAANAEREGYRIATLIHDQALSFYAPEQGQTAEEFTRLLTTLPKWADGLPVAAEGGLVPFYRKD